ncbi:MAG: FAD-dependent monooxygenase [Pseudomonadota bacterium]
MRVETDILIIGGGVAGLAATAAFAASGRRAICVDRAPVAAGMNDTRTTAFLKPAVAVLEDAGVWPLLSGETAALDVMRLIDAGGRENAAREIADFAADEIGEPPFGWNVPNAAMRQALNKRIEQLETAEQRAETAIEDLIVRRDHALARLSDGSTIKAQLVVGADGRNSTIRDMAGISARRWDYGQKALVFTVAMEEPHFGVSTEIHRTGGPFTLVPMPDGEDGPRCSVVWMERAGEAERLAALPVPEFEEALNERALGVHGRLKLASGRAAWPIISLIAERLTAPRIALIAESAHVVPPIGAQGLNMSLGDIETLMKAVAAGGGDPGAATALSAYQRRWPELAARVSGVDALNRAALTKAQPLRDLRRVGLTALTQMRPAKALAMRLGMGAR